MEKDKTLRDPMALQECLSDEWKSGAPESEGILCGTPDLEILTPIAFKWEAEEVLGNYHQNGRRLDDLSPTDWMIENHPEVWMKVVKEYWEGIPLDFGNIDPDESYFIKKCFEEIDRKRAQV